MGHSLVQQQLIFNGTKRVADVSRTERNSHRRENSRCQLAKLSQLALALAGLDSVSGSATTAKGRTLNQLPAWVHRPA